MPRPPVKRHDRVNVVGHDDEGVDLDGESLRKSLDLRADDYAKRAEVDLVTHNATEDGATLERADSHQIGACGRVVVATNARMLATGHPAMV